MANKTYQIEFTMTDGTKMVAGTFTVPQGERGPTGPQGPAGTKGADGSNGKDGATGATPSITAKATVGSGVGTPSVTVTKTGTDASPILTFAFLNLKGEKGDTGSRGPQGLQGPQGERGLQGATGPTGPKGNTGSQGPQGPSGTNAPIFSFARFTSTSSYSVEKGTGSGGTATLAMQANVPKVTIPKGTSANLGATLTCTGGTFTVSSSKTLRFFAMTSGAMTHGELQISTNRSSWTTIATLKNNADAGTFSVSAGTYYVRLYNFQGFVMSAAVDVLCWVEIFEN